LHETAAAIARTAADIESVTRFDQSGVSIFHAQVFRQQKAQVGFALGSVLSGFAQSAGVLVYWADGLGGSLSP